MTKTAMRRHHPSAVHSAPVELEVAPSAGSMDSECSGPVPFPIPVPIRRQRKHRGHAAGFMTAREVGRCVLLGSASGAFLLCLTVMALGGRRLGEIGGVSDGTPFFLRRLGEADDRPEPSLSSAAVPPSKRKLIDDSQIDSFRSPSEEEELDAESRTAACLIVMDDSHFFPEWLAYHYHVMNLRHLIVAIDPGSRTSPQPIFDRWEGRMTIEVWDDGSRYLGKDQHDFEEGIASRMKSKLDEKGNARLSLHRERQARFNMECLRTLKRAGEGWTFIVDTDEFVYVNPAIADGDRNKENNDDDAETGLPRWPDAIPISEAGSVPSALRRLAFPSTEYGMVHPCVRIKRTQYSSLESDPDQVGEGFPSEDLSGLGPDQFMTLRWRKRGWINSSHPNLPGKVIVDLGRLRMQDLESDENTGNPHRPLGLICPLDDMFRTEEKAILLANHYLGTMEQWTSRDKDARGSDCLVDLYKHYNSILGGSEGDELRPWLAGFVRSVGPAEATRLLEGAGVVKSKPPSDRGETILSLPSPELPSILRVGDRIEAYYSASETEEAGSGWYSAVVAASSCRGNYDIVYDDGSHGWSYCVNEIRREGSNETIFDELEQRDAASE